MSTNDRYTSGRRRVLKTLAASAAASTAVMALGRALGQENYPNRVIKISLGVPPGGSAELVLRPLIQQLSPRLGQPIIIEYRPGANQTISMAFVAKAPPDGYTLGFATDAPYSLAPALPQALAYDARADFVPIAILEHVALLLVTQPSNPINSLVDLVAQAKAKPGKISYGSLGVGSIAHVALEVFALENGIELLHVPYKGVAPAVTAGVSGEVDLTFVSVGPNLPFIPARLKPLALASVQRSQLLPNVPTFIESGYKDFDVRAWFGLLAPRQTPQPIVGRLQQEIWRIASSKDFIQNTIVPTAAEPSSVPPERLESFLRADQEKWVKWVKRLGPKIKLT
jgi:tripartite-type tricarboxylate transporter receptor subunit TctC